MNSERENYSWGIIQDMIEREINSAFKLREPSILPNCNLRAKYNNGNNKTNHSRHQG
jgi:hypothetical protein